MSVEPPQWEKPPTHWHSPKHSAGRLSMVTVTKSTVASRSSARHPRSMRGRCFPTIFLAIWSRASIATPCATRKWPPRSSLKSRRAETCPSSSAAPGSILNFSPTAHLRYLREMPPCARSSMPARWRICSRNWKNSIPRRPPRSPGRTAAMSPDRLKSVCSQVHKSRNSAMAGNRKPELSRKD